MKRLRRAYPLKLELVPLMLLVASFNFVVANYGRLPQKIPTHFDAAGNPDGWGAKGILILLLVVEVGLLYLPSTMFAYALSAVGDFRPMINLPGKRQWTPDQAEAVRVWVLRLMFVTKTLAIGLLTFILYNAIKVAQGKPGSLFWVVWVLVAVLVVSTLFIVWKLLAIARAKS